MDPRTSILQSLGRTATWNGGSIVIVALLSALLAGGWMILFCLAVAGAALGEVVGGRLAQRDPGRGRVVLLTSQFDIALLIAGYAAYRLVTFDVGELGARFAAAGLADFAAMAADPAGRDLLTLAFRLTYAILIAVTLAYQGGMAWHYHASIRRALAETP